MAPILKKTGLLSGIIGNLLFYLVLLVFRTMPLQAQLDFKYDSVLYKTLYPSHLREFLNDHPDAVIFDVRSPGEYEDSSMFRSLNLGHINGAINFPLDSIQKSLPRMSKFKDKPVLVYCSHSSRSRRACKQLVENGFNNVVNINGGMYWMSQAEEKNFPGKSEFVISKLPFSNLPVNAGIKLIKEAKKLLILDVRNPSEFQSKDTNELLNLGRIRKSINIPMDELNNKLSQLLPYKEFDILVCDHHGVLSPKAAMLLFDNGFKKISNLIGGISALYEKTTTAVRKEVLENQPQYMILSPLESIDLIRENKSLVILDLRPLDEYNNSAKEAWRNRGRIKNAIHISPENFRNELDKLASYKESDILIYGNGDQVKNCKYLSENGFKHISFLFGGIYGLIYAYANIEGYRNVKGILDNYEGIY